MSGIKKPSIKKPINGIKKPAVKPKAPVIKEEVVEEKVVEIPVVVDQVEEIAPELEEILAQDEKHQEQEEQQIVEEVNEEPVQEPEPEPVVEEKPKAKKSRKSTKKKEEPKVEEEPIIEEDLNNMSLNDALVKLNGTFEYTVPEWEEAKQEIQDRLKSTTIDPDADPGVMRMLIAELDEFVSELRLVRSNTNDQVKAITERVEYIRLSNSKGTNSEERKASGYKALMNYKVNPDDTETINLIEYKLFFESQLNFYDETIETLKDRKQLLITFSSMMKIESNF
jgi:hypothetical protein